MRSTAPAALFRLDVNRAARTPIATDSGSLWTVAPHDRATVELECRAAAESAIVQPSKNVWMQAKVRNGQPNVIACRQESATCPAFFKCKPAAQKGQIGLMHRSIHPSSSKLPKTAPVAIQPWSWAISGRIQKMLTPSRTPAVQGRARFCTVG